MKKLIIAGTLALSIAALPMLGLAVSNPFTQLVNNAEKVSTASDQGKCGLPDPSKNPDEAFCDCFTQELVSGCNKQPVHPKCDASHIRAAMDSLGDNYDVICHRYPPDDPAVSIEECKGDLQYWHDNCPH